MSRNKWIAVGIAIVGLPLFWVVIAYIRGLTSGAMELCVFWSGLGAVLISVMVASGTAPKYATWSAIVLAVLLPLLTVLFGSTRTAAGVTVDEVPEETPEQGAPVPATLAEATSFLKEPELFGWEVTPTEATVTLDRAASPILYAMNVAYMDRLEIEITGGSLYSSLGCTTCWRAGMEEPWLFLLSSGRETLKGFPTIVQMRREGVRKNEDDPNRFLHVRFREERKGWGFVLGTQKLLNEEEAYPWGRVPTVGAGGRKLKAEVTVCFLDKDTGDFKPKHLFTPMRRPRVWFSPALKWQDLKVKSAKECVLPASTFSASNASGRLWIAIPEGFGDSLVVVTWLVQ